MTEFLQEYGKIVVAVLVVMALVAVVVLFREPVTEMFQGMFESFFKSMGEDSGLTLPEFNPGGRG